MCFRKCKRSYNKVYIFQDFKLLMAKKRDVAVASKGDSKLVKSKEAEKLAGEARALLKEAKRLFFL